MSLEASASGNSASDEGEELLLKILVIGDAGEKRRAKRKCVLNVDSRC